MLRFADLIQNPRRFLALTGYTVDEFRALLSFFIVRFQAYVAIFTLAGQPRRNRTSSTYKNSSLPTMEDKLLLILNYLKTSPLQESHAQVFGMQQSQASQWMHLVLPLVKASLADGGALPARKGEDSTLAEDEAGLFFHDGTEAPSIVLKTQKSSTSTTAASRRNTPSRMMWSLMNRAKSVS